jgi:hypothetical protein
VPDGQKDAGLQGSLLFGDLQKNPAGQIRGPTFPPAQKKALLILASVPLQNKACNGLLESVLQNSEQSEQVQGIAFVTFEDTAKVS